MRPFSIYVHIPFCRRRCPYCDFNTYAVSTIPEKEYIGALLAEIDYRAALKCWHGRLLRSIYFGGGTPSLFSPFSIRKIIDAITSRFPVADDIEITLEANPGSTGAENLAALRRAGVNRLSLGAQTFQEDLLRRLGRLHNVDQIDAVVSSARAAEFANVSLDLIYGIPGQTLEQVKADIARLILLRPEHVSAYGLTVEKGTPFYVEYRKGQLTLPDEELVMAMMKEVDRGLRQAGFERYEISNFSRPGREARHNLVYWEGGDYIGVGAGAHSFVAEYEGELRLKGNRWANFALPEKYIQHCTAFGHAESWKEDLFPPDLMFEYFFLGLRKIRGVSCAEFGRLFGSSVEQVYPEVLQILFDENLLRRDGDYLRLTEQGLLLADSVIENFVLEDDRSLVHPTRAVTEIRINDAANG